MESAITVLSRHALLLAPPCAQDSLLRLKDHRQCFECSDVALQEAVQQMVNASESAAKEAGSTEAVPRNLNLDVVAS